MTEADKVREMLHKQTSYLIARITQLTAERDTFQDLAEIANGQALDARANEKHLRAVLQEIAVNCEQAVRGVFDPLATIKAIQAIIMQNRPAPKD